MASAVSTDSGDTPIDSIYNWFSQTKYSYNNVIAIAVSNIAGIFWRNTHCAIKLVTCMWQSFSFSISLRRAVFSLHRSLCKSQLQPGLQCDSNLQLSDLTCKDGETHSWLMFPSSQSCVSLIRSTTPWPLYLYINSQKVGFVRTWAAAPGAGWWSKRSGSRHGLGGTARRCASRSLVA